MKCWGSNLGMTMMWAPAERGWSTFMVRPKMWNIGMTERKLYWGSPEDGSKGSLAQPEAMLLVRQTVLVRLD